MKKRRKGQRVNGYYPLLLLDPFLCLFLKAGTSGGARKPALKGKPSPRSPRPTHGERSGYSEREGLLSLPREGRTFSFLGYRGLYPLVLSLQGLRLLLRPVEEGPLNGGNSLLLIQRGADGESYPIPLPTIRWKIS